MALDPCHCIALCILESDSKCMDVWTDHDDDDDDDYATF